MSEVGVTRDQIDIVRWTSSNDLGRRAAALLQRQNYGEGGKTVMKEVNLLGVPEGLLSVTFPDLPEASFTGRLQLTPLLEVDTRDCFLLLLFPQIKQKETIKSHTHTNGIPYTLNMDL